MKVIQRKNDYVKILEALEGHSPWTEAEQSNPITQTVWFTQLILLIIEFKNCSNKELLAFEIFGTMCRYINRNYSINPAKNLLSSLEINSKRVKKPKNNDFIIDLIQNICDAGYGRCGTSTLIPFLSWMMACGVTLKQIRETLISATIKFEKKIENTRGNKRSKMLRRIKRKLSSMSDLLFGLAILVCVILSAVLDTDEDEPYDFHQEDCGKTSCTELIK